MNLVSRNITVFPVEICDKIYSYYRHITPKKSHPNADMIRNCFKIIDCMDGGPGKHIYVMDYFYNIEVDENGYNEDLDDAYYHFGIVEDFHYDVKSTIFTKGWICDGSGRRWWEVYNDLCDKETGEIIVHVGPILFL